MAGKGSAENIKMAVEVEKAACRKKHIRMKRMNAILNGFSVYLKNYICYGYPENNYEQEN